MQLLFSQSSSGKDNQLKLKQQIKMSIAKTIKVKTNCLKKWILTWFTFAKFDSGKLNLVEIITAKKNPVMEAIIIKCVMGKSILIEEPYLSCKINAKKSVNPSENNSAKIKLEN